MMECMGTINRVFNEINIFFLLDIISNRIEEFKQDPEVIIR